MSTTLRILFCALALLLGLHVRGADLIPASSLITWTPGTHTGVPGGIPTDRSTTIDVTASPYNADNTGATNAGTAIQAAIDAASSGNIVLLPAGRYRVNETLTIGLTKDNITLRGAGIGVTIIDSRANTAVSVGGGDGFAIPPGADAADMMVTAGLSKGSDEVTLADVSTLSEGQVIRFTVEDDLSIPIMHTEGYQGLVGQTVKITAISGNDITFTPALYSDFGAGALDVGVRALAAQVEGVGIEDMTIDVDNYAGDRAFAGIAIAQGLGCWIKGVRIDNVGSYPISLSSSLFVEARRNYLDTRKGDLITSNGGGFLVNAVGASLIEDNEVVNHFPGIEVNYGSSGNFVSRNYFVGPSSIINTNHNPWNQFNLYEGNSGEGGLLADGYFGGVGPDVIHNNKLEYLSLKRMTYFYAVVANFINRAPSGFTTKTGNPNLGNDSNNGNTANFPGTPWPDWGMTGTIATNPRGTGTGYLVNNGAGYSAGATTIAADTGTGTILVDDVVTFSGSPVRYLVTAALSGGTFEIGNNSYGHVGLETSVSDNATITVSSDNMTATLASGYSLPAYSGSGDYQVVRLHWAGYASSEGYRVTTYDSGTRTVGLISGGAFYPNRNDPPAISTAVNVWAGKAAWQERDMKVDATLTRKGNRWSDNTFDTLDGGTVSDSLAYSSKPAWLTAAETEFSATFNLKAFDPVTPLPASDSNIPAGYRYNFLSAPVEDAAFINSAGDRLTISFSKPVVIGTGGSGGLTFGNDVTFTFIEMVGSTAVYSTSRVITDEETTLNLDYTQPGNGIEDPLGNDLASFTGLSVSNASNQSAGAIWVQPVALADTNSSTNLSNVASVSMPIVVDVSGYVAKLRIGIADVGYAPVAGKVALKDAANEVVVTASGTYELQDDYQVFSVTSTYITAGTYYIDTVSNGNAEPPLAILTSQPADSAFYSFVSPSYAAWPPSTITPDGGSTVKYAFGLRIIPDPVTYTPGKLRMLRR
jgi:hypothetical protein